MIAFFNLPTSLSKLAKVQFKIHTGTSLQYPHLYAITGFSRPAHLTGRSHPDPGLNDGYTQKLPFMKFRSGQNDGAALPHSASGPSPDSRLLVVVDQQYASC